jgi:hypothetical protein
MAGVALGVVLVAWVAAHVVVVVGLARRGAWLRAAAALVVPPLAPWWAWRTGLRTPAVAWGAALGLYAIGTVLAAWLTSP